MCRRWPRSAPDRPLRRSRPPTRWPCRPGSAATDPTWLPDGPSGTTGVSSSTSRASLRVGSSEGTSSASGDSSRYERTPSSLRATTMTQSAVWPSSTTGFSPLTTHCAALRRARVRTVWSGSPCPCSPSATVPRRVAGGQVGQQLCRLRVHARPAWPPPTTRRTARAAECGPSARGRRTFRAGPLPLPPYASGTSRPVHPSSTSVDHSAGVTPVRFVGQPAHDGGRALALERTAGHVLQCELLVVVREVHGLPYVSLSAAPFPDTGVRVHGGPLPFPSWISPLHPRMRSSATSCGPGSTRTCPRSWRPKRSATTPASRARRASSVARSGSASSTRAGGPPSTGAPTTRRAAPSTPCSASSTRR